MTRKEVSFLNDLPENRHLRFIIKLFYFVLIAAAAYVIYKYMIKWLMPFLISFLVSASIQKPVRMLEKRLHIPRKIACLLLVFFVYGIVGAAVGTLIYWFINSLRDFAATLPDLLSELPEVIERLTGYLQKYYKLIPGSDGKTLTDTVSELIGGLTASSIDMSGIFGTVKNVAFSIPTVLIFIIALFVGSFYISSDFDRVRDFILAQFSEKIRESTTRLVSHLLHTFTNWFKAIGIMIVITFFELMVGFLLMRLDYAVVLAIAIALVDALPVFGAGTVLIPWTIFSLLTGAYMRGLYLALLYIVILIVRNAMEPKILGTRIGLHPLIMLMCLYLGYVTLGFLGMFVLPVCLIAVERLQAWGYIHIFNTPDYMKAEIEDYPDPVETIKQSIKNSKRKK